MQGIGGAPQHFLPFAHLDKGIFMHINKTIKIKSGFTDLILRIFSAIFWILVMLGFDGVDGALITLLAVLIHEMGHLAALFILGHKDGVPLPRMPGFSIKVCSTLSYKKDIAVAASGPLANLLTALILLPARQMAEPLILISILTAISNLLPVRGYDGYRILESAIALSGASRFLGRLPDILSFCTVVAAVLLSLYFIYTFDAGYWIFGVFFIFLIREVKKTLK